MDNENCTNYYGSKKEYTRLTGNELKIIPIFAWRTFRRFKFNL